MATDTDDARGRLHAKWADAGFLDPQQPGYRGYVSGISWNSKYNKNVEIDGGGSGRAMVEGGPALGALRSRPETRFTSHRATRRGLERRIVRAAERRRACCYCEERGDEERPSPDNADGSAAPLRRYWTGRGAAGLRPVLLRDLRMRLPYRVRATDQERRGRIPPAREGSDARVA